MQDMITQTENTTSVPLLRICPAIIFRRLHRSTKRGDAENPLASGRIINAYGLEMYASTDWDDDGGSGDETADNLQQNSVSLHSSCSKFNHLMILIMATSVVADVLFGAALSHAASSTAMVLLLQQCVIVNWGSLCSPKLN